jgi:hypothetical protein
MLFQSDRLRRRAAAQCRRADEIANPETAAPNATFATQLGIARRHGRRQWDRDKTDVYTTYMSKSPASFSARAKQSAVSGADVPALAWRAHL